MLSEIIRRSWFQKGLQNVIVWEWIYSQLSLATKFIEIKIDGVEAISGLNSKQREGLEYTKDLDGGSLLHLVKDPKCQDCKK